MYICIQTCIHIFKKKLAQWLLNNHCEKFIDAFWLEMYIIVPFDHELVCVALKCRLSVKRLAN